MKLKQNMPYIFLILVGLYIVLLSNVIKSDQLKYFYWHVKNGSHFDSPLKDYKLNGGYVFIEKDNEKGIYSVVHRESISNFLTVFTKDLVDLSILQEKGLLLIREGNDKCKLYENASESLEYLVSIDDLVIVSFDIPENMVFDWKILCTMIVHNK